MKVIAYVRCSTADQADSGGGIAAQKAAILAEATRRGWDEASVEWIEDAGFSAKSLKRPGLALALDALRAGDAQVLAVAKMDRLSRSLLDFASICQKAQKEGWALLALDSPADMSTPQGEAMASVLAVFAQLERRLIGQRTSDALKAKAAAGVRLGRPPVLPTRIVNKIVRQHTAGASYSAIARDLNERGVPTAHGGTKWHPATVRKIVLSNR